MSYQNPLQASLNKYLYNGKELQSDLGLNWLDYGFRMYDPQIGRWNRIDPMIEDHYDYTPYAYVYNNPMNFIDPFGLDTIQGGQLSEIVVKPPSWLKRQWKKFASWWKQKGSEKSSLEGNGGTQNGGIPQVKSGESISPTKYNAKYPDQTINIDLLLISRKGSIRVNQNPLNVTKTIKKAGKGGILLKEALDKSKGTGVKTDANGKPIKNSSGNSSSAKPIGRTAGDTIITVVRGNLGLHFEDTLINKSDLHKHQKDIDFYNRIK